MQLEHERRQLKQMDELRAHEQRILEMHFAYQAGYRNRHAAAMQSAAQPQPAELGIAELLDGVEDHASATRSQLAPVSAQHGAALQVLRSASLLLVRGFASYICTGVEFPAVLQGRWQ
jgi:hypothetical protein